MSKHLLRSLLFREDSFLHGQLDRVKKLTGVGSAKEIDHQASSDQTQLLLYLVALRVFPGTPNWLMNLTFPHIGIPDHLFLLSVFLGLATWNYIVCEAGRMLSLVNKKEDVINSQVYLQLACIGGALVFLALLKRWLGKSKAVSSKKQE